MAVLLFLIIDCIFGFVLFSKVRLNDGGEPLKSNEKVSVIIPARNEGKNLPFILSSLQTQTVQPYEIIVVDDFSSDATATIAEQYGVKVIRNTELPANWTGKTWAVWQGFLRSTGDILVFLDADVRLSPRALEALLRTREQSGGVISVVPYHYMEKFYERLSLITCILGIFAFTSPFERRNTRKGLYGSCIVATRKDYEQINGHRSIQSEVLDDLSLGKRFSEAGIHVENFIGCDLVSFRMYPNGIKSEMQGFAKSAVLGTETLRAGTIFLIAFWVIGLLATGLVTPFLLLFRHPWALPFLAGYIIYTIQLIYFLNCTGRYGWLVPIMHFLSSMFFILMMLYSVYQVAFVGSVTWKGRQIKVGGEKSK